MCAGAISRPRIGRLIYGAEDPKGGAVRSCFSDFRHPEINRRVEVIRRSACCGARRGGAPEVFRGETVGANAVA